MNSQYLNLNEYPYLKNIYSRDVWNQGIEATINFKLDKECTNETNEVCLFLKDIYGDDHSYELTGNLTNEFLDLSAPITLEKIFDILKTHDEKLKYSINFKKNTGKFFIEFKTHLPVKNGKEFKIAGELLILKEELLFEGKGLGIWHNPFGLINFRAQSLKIKCRIKESKFQKADFETLMIIGSECFNDQNKTFHEGKCIPVEMTGQIDLNEDKKSSIMFGLMPALSENQFLFNVIGWSVIFVNEKMSQAFRHLHFIDTSELLITFQTQFFEVGLDNLTVHPGITIRGNYQL